MRTHQVQSGLFLAVIGASLVGCSRQSVPAAGAGEVRIAAAADLKFALDDIVADFRKQHPDIKVTTTYGSSGNFFAQLSNKAPFDIYFSADIEYPRKLVEKGLVSKDTEFKYAVGHLVVWVPNGSKLDVEKVGIGVLTDPSVRKVAIANPKHAPYGRAAEAALKKLGVYDRVQDRLVLGENVMQTAQFVESGAADVGIIPLSLALAPTMRDKGRYWPVPPDAHPRLEQGGVILSWAADPDAAAKLKDFVIAGQGKATLGRYGFTLLKE